MKVPLIDLSSGPTPAVGAALRRACCETGFFQVTGHGVPKALTAGILREAASFFALPQESKDALSIRRSSSWRGYQRVHENVTGGRPDRHEALDYYSESRLAERPRGHFGANPWPSELPTFRPTVEAYVGEMTRVGSTIMRAVAPGLELDEDHFAPFYDEPFWCLRAIHYPPAPAAARAEAEELGCGTHTDYGCLTLVHADDTPGVLQAQTTHGEWITVEQVPGAFTCNVGDMLARWTNGLFASTPHRVLPPPGVSRISVPFFFEPNYTALIEPIPQCCSATGHGPRYTPIMYGDHLFAKTSTNFAPVEVAGALP